MKNIFLLIVVLYVNNLYSQNCICRENNIAHEYDTEPFETFEFKNGISLRLCALSYFTVNKKVFYNDFRIENCSNNMVIAFWDDKVLCNVYFKNDTISIHETIEFPTKNKKKFERKTYRIINYYYKDGFLANNSRLSPIPKYSNTELNEIILEYTNALRGKKTNFKYLYTSLLIAKISGSVVAENYFMNFRNQFKSRMTETDINEYENLKSYFTIYP